MNTHAFIIGMLLVVPTVSCQNESMDMGKQGYPTRGIAESENRVINSSVTGRTYEISVAFPRGYEEVDTLYPVLFALDSNIHFGTLVETVRALALDGIPEPLIVGVGYPVGRYINSYGTRAVDLTPTSDPEAIEWFKKEYPERPVMESTGGGAKFLRFILEELIPLIEADYKASPEERGLFGWSFSGLFAAYVLFEAKGEFNRFIIMSPSLWWDERIIFEMEGEFAEANDSLDARIFFSVGALEGFEMIPDLQKFSEALGAREYEGLSQQLYVIENESHYSVIPATISKGLRFIYGGEEQ